MTNELIDRCPDCDGKPYVEYHQHQSTYAPRIVCYDCGFNILFRRGDITKLIAIKQWNDIGVCRRTQYEQR